MNGLLLSSAPLQVFLVLCSCTQSLTPLGLSRLLVQMRPLECRHGSRSSARRWAPWFKPVVQMLPQHAAWQTTTTGTATGATAASLDTSTESSVLRQCEAAADHRRRREQVFAGGKDNLAELVEGGQKSRVRSGL